MAQKKHSKEYESYINSFDWYLKSRKALAKANHQCQRCGATQGLEVHHKTYDRLGKEPDADLMVVCPSCHREADAERANVVRANRYRARLNGWATKVYGENWHMLYSVSDLEDEFDAFLERQ